METEYIAKQIATHLVTMAHSREAQITGGFESFAALRNAVGPASEFEVENALRYMRGKGFIEQDIIRFRLTAKGRDYALGGATKGGKTEGIREWAKVVIGGIIATMVCGIIIYSITRTEGPPTTQNPTPEQNIEKPSTTSRIYSLSDGLIRPQTVGVAVHATNVQVRDFLLDVKFFNPPPGREPFDYGIIFRESKDDGFWLVLKSTGDWELYLRDDALERIISTGPIPDFNNSPYGSNTIHLDVISDTGDFSLNGHKIGKLYLGDRLSIGTIFLANGVYASSVDENLDFQDLEIYSR